MLAQPVRQISNFLCIFPVCILLSCSQGTPVIHESFHQIVRIQTDNGFTERLSVFVHYEDPEGPSDFGSILVRHADSGLEWAINSENRNILLRGTERWTGSGELAGPSGAIIPEGSYTVSVLDLAGNESSSSFTLVRPAFPEKSPVVFTIRGDSWFINHNPDALSFSKTFIFLYDQQSRLVYSYPVGGNNAQEISGKITDLESLAENVHSVRCFSENEEGTAGVLLIPVNLR